MQSSFTNVYFSRQKVKRDICNNSADCFLFGFPHLGYQSIEIFERLKSIFCWYFRDSAEWNVKHFVGIWSLKLVLFIYMFRWDLWLVNEQHISSRKNTSRLHHRMRWESKFKTRVAGETWVLVETTLSQDYATVCTLDYPKRVLDLNVLLPDALQCRHCLWSNSTVVKSFWVQTSRNFFFHEFWFSLIRSRLLMRLNLSRILTVFFNLLNDFFELLFKVTSQHHSLQQSGSWVRFVVVVDAWIIQHFGIFINNKQNISRVISWNEISQPLPFLCLRSLAWKSLRSLSLYDLSFIQICVTKF